MLNLLFVYGTLRSQFDIAAARMLRECAELLGSATVPGSIYRIRHYPGFRPEPDPASAGLVHGELYRLKDPAPLIDGLDAYEDTEFTRVMTTVEQDGVAKDAWIYRYDAPLPPDSLIASGDFCA